MGLVVTITDSSGDIVEKYTYDVYGNVIIKGNNDNVLSQSNINNRYMFTGREYDEESGLYYYRARMYSSELGRFLQPDPISYYDSMNLYQYVKNNPVNWIDPMGLCCREWRVLIWHWKSTKFIPTGQPETYYSDWELNEALAKQATEFVYKLGSISVRCVWERKVTTRTKGYYEMTITKVYIVYNTCEGVRTETEVEVIKGEEFYKKDVSIETTYTFGTILPAGRATLHIPYPK